MRSANKQIGKTRFIAIELIIHGIYKRFFDKKLVPYHTSYKLITHDLPLHLLVICIIQSVVKLAPERHWCIHTQLSRSWRWCSHLWHCRSKSHNILKRLHVAKLHDPYHCHSEALVILCDLIEKLHECFSRSNHSEAIFAKRRLDKNQFEGDFWKIFPKLKGLNDPWVFFTGELPDFWC